ncbi:FecR domain-containing protein [Opitutales bacterium]|nr:FecR domain-containing protein [Opitutales bacterium]
MRNLPFPLFLTFLSLFSCLSLHAIDSKGAIIIASMEGQITVTNNKSGKDLPSDQVKVGGLLFDGHTVKTGTGSKIVLLFSSGTITTLKEGSVLNIKKFVQQNFDPKIAGKLSARKDEPSPSETVIDLSLGDMVVDVKKLKKESSFNIDSPVGTAGIRGTIPRMKVVKLPDGGFNQTTQMLKGKISYMPKGGGRPMLLGPGQSLASGISAAGMVLPFQIGKVPVAVMDAIQAEVDKSSAATGKAADGPPPADTPDSNPEDDAPSDDELNESDEDRQAAGKGVGDDDNGSEALALEKAGILDLENPEDAAKAGTYVEVAGTAAEMLDQKVNERRSGRRSTDSNKDEGTFVSDLVSNFGNVVDVTEESEALGLKDSSKISSFAESAEQSGDLLAVLGDAQEIGAKNSENMDAVFSNPDKATNLKKVIGAAKDAFSSDRRSGDGEISQDGKDTMSAMFRTAEKADEVAAVVESAEATKSTDSAQGEKKVLGVFKVVNSVDKAEQDQKAAEVAALKAAAEATAQKAAEEAAAQRAADELAAAQAAGNAEAIAAAQAASEAAAKKKAAVDDYSAKLESIKSASDSVSVDALLAEFNGAHDADIVSLLAFDGFDLSVNADARRSAIKAEASAAQKENVFGNLETVSDLAVSSIEVEEQAAAQAALAEGKKAAASDYQQKLTDIAKAETVDEVEAIVAAFADSNVNPEEYRDGLDLTSVATARRNILEATDDAARIAAEEASLVAAAQAAARAKAKVAAAERDKADAEAKAADTGFDSMIENADQATELKQMVDKNAEIEAAATKAKEDAAAALLVAQESGDATAIAAAEATKAAADSASENKADLGDLLKNADKMKAMAKVMKQAEELDTSGDSSTFTALLKNPQGAEKLAKVIEDSTTGGGEGEGEAVVDTDKLNVMFNVVKSSDAKKQASKKLAADAAASGAFVPFEVEELILASEDKAQLKQWKTSGIVGEDDLSTNAPSLGLLQTLIDDRIEEINSNNIYEQIDTVVDVAKTTLDQLGDAGLDSILDNPDKADDLKILVDQAVSSGGADGAADLLSNVLDNAEKATELSEVVSSAAEEGIDVTKLLENAQEADSLLKAKKAADEVATQAEEQKRAEIAASGQNLSDDEIAAQVAAAKSSAKNEVMESVAANAENAESVATVLDAAAGADAETKAALLRNADEAVAMAQTINEEIAIKAAAAEAAAADAVAVEAAAALLEDQKSGASADELAAIQAEIDAVRLAAEQKKAAEAKFSTDLLSATSLGQVEDALNEYKLILSEGEAVPESISSLATSRKKNLSLINVVKQVDGNKQEAKAIAAQAENALVSTTFRDAAQSKTSISELEQLLNENLPSAITDTALKSKIFKAKTESKIRELLSAFDTGVVDVAVDHWMVVFPKKEELNAVLAFQSIDSLADVASRSAVVAEDIIYDEGTSQESKDSIDQARNDLEIAESIEEIDGILAGLAELNIEIPDGLSNYADLLKKSINTLNAVLDNAEQADQVASMDAEFLDELSSGGDDFDFDAVISTGALGALKSSEFVDLGLVFDEFYSVDQTTEIPLSSDISSFSEIGTDFLNNPESITDSDGNTVYSLSGTQVDNLTGESGGIDGVYSFIETLDPDTDEVIGVVISPSSKKIGVDGVDSFAVDSDRASDVLLILESEALKTLDSDTDEEKVKKAELRDDFIANADQLDNLLKLNRAIGEDQEKVETALENLTSLDDLAAVSDRLRFDTEKLNKVFSILDDPEIDDLTKSENLMYFRSLSDKFHTSPSKLDAVFSNTDKLEVLDDLTDRLDKNLEGSTEEKGQVNLLFANLDYADEYLDIVNRFEGTKRDSVLKDINRLVTTNPTRKDIIFSNPTQVSSLNKLYQEFKFEPTRVEIIFEHAEKADAFLDVLNDLRGPDGFGNFDVLFTNPISTMENQGLAKLKAEYPERYWSIFDENLDRAAEISFVASKFKENEEFLELVFTNIDKLDDINKFTNEFGYIELVDVLVDESTGEVVQKEVFKYDDILMSIFFANIDNLAEINDFKSVVESVGIPGGDALKIFDNEPGWLSFVLDGEISIEFDADDRLILSTDQLKAGQFLADLYASGVPVTEIPLALAEELFTLGLTRNELKLVLEDLLDGPILNPPGSNPPSNDENDPTTNADLKTLNFLLDHTFSGNISSDLLVSAEIAMASSFFKESMNVFEELSMLGESLDQFVPDSDDQIHDSGSDGTISFSDYETDDRRVGELDLETEPTDLNYEGEGGTTQITDDPNYPEGDSIYANGETGKQSEYPDSNYEGGGTSAPVDGVDDHHSDGEHSLDFDGVLGGRNLSFGSGNYDLSLLAYNRLLFASSDLLSLSGEVSFSVGQDKEIYNQLILMSAGGLKIEKGSKVRFEGESLGFGSFNTLRVIEVDLFAQDEISLRSLDRLVIENSDMTTSGRGVHDAVELLAHQEISVDNLRFNENIKRIAMEAMTINLSNLNFPAGSEVKLNSAHGGLDGKYPNFNSILYGRVNFIKNIRYATNPIMDRPSFDKYGGSVSIGKIGN